jgi:hypothetical protein
MAPFFISRAFAPSRQLNIAKRGPRLDGRTLAVRRLLRRTKRIPGKGRRLLALTPPRPASTVFCHLAWNLLLQHYFPVQRG